MAVKLRLMRMGKKKQPTYRLVAADARSPRNGRFIEILGFYDPRSEPSTIRIDNEKAVSWLREGAQPTERVEKLLKISGAWTEFTGEAPPPSVTRAGVAVVDEEAAEDAAASTDAEAEASADEAAPVEAEASADDAATAEEESAGADDAAATEVEVADTDAVGDDTDAVGDDSDTDGGDTDSVGDDTDGGESE